MTTAAPTGAFGVVWGRTERVRRDAGRRHHRPPTRSRPGEVRSFGPRPRARRAELVGGLRRGQRARVLAAAVRDDQVRPHLGRTSGEREGRGLRIGDRQLSPGRGDSLRPPRPCPARGRSTRFLAAGARPGSPGCRRRRRTPACAAGATLIDIRPAAQRAAAGEVPGSVVIERNHLEMAARPRERGPAALGHRVRPAADRDLYGGGIRPAWQRPRCRTSAWPWPPDVAGGYQALAKRAGCRRRARTSAPPRSRRGASPGC